MTEKRFNLIRLKGVGLLYRVGGQAQPSDLLLLLADDIHGLHSKSLQSLANKHRYRYRLYGTYLLSIS